MCGIAGFWDITHSYGVEEAGGVLRGMTRAISHRGPDDDGHFHDAPAGIALGHRRLSIIDLSPLGHQPITSPSGRYVMVYNGEVYNHVTLRPELERQGVVFRGHSDTEVMLAAIECWGLEKALARFVGMFAFALWDRASQSLVLVRDRLGIKPLYFGWVGPVFVFGSELKAIKTLPGFDSPVDRDALCLFLRHNYIVAPHSIYAGIRKLVPGALLRVDRTLAANRDPDAAVAAMQPFWSAREVAEAGMRDPLALDDAAATDALDKVLRQSVALRMEADVSLGAFLSGGIDSSSVVALMQAQSQRPVQTFSIGFNEQGYDEAQYAKAVAKHLGTDHHELYLSAHDALDVVPQLPAMFDEPFSDSSQIPTYLVSKMARRHVTVSLSGDGGDELFCGYGRYFHAERIRRMVERVPSSLRRSVASSMANHPGLWGGLFASSNRLLPNRLRLRNPRDKVATLANILGARDDDARYRMLVSHWRDPAAIVAGAVEPLTALSDPALRPAINGSLERMMVADLVTYLPGDILTKVDRASMAVSLEARVPLLDHRVVEFAWRLPVHQKVRNGQGKWLLRQLLYRYVPKHLIDRPKMGFGVPIDAWLHGPLRDWAESLLTERRLREDGYFNPSVIRRMWDDHLAGHVKEHYRLWDILMFQAWFDASRAGSATTIQDATACVL